MTLAAKIVQDDIAKLRSWKEIEKEAILNAVKICGTANRAAKALGIGNTTIYRKLKQYRIQIRNNGQ